MVQKKQRNKSQRSLKIIVYSEVVVLHCTRETGPGINVRCPTTQFLNLKIVRPIKLTAGLKLNHQYIFSNIKVLFIIYPMGMRI